jgi:hypothetical protein
MNPPTMAVCGSSRRYSRNAAALVAGRPGRFHPDAAESDAIPRLAPGVGLIVVLFLLIGLWGAVWLVVSALGSVWPWYRRRNFESERSSDRKLLSDAAAQQVKWSES